MVKAKILRPKFQTIVAYLVKVVWRKREGLYLRKNNNILSSGNRIPWFLLLIEEGSIVASLASARGNAALIATAELMILDAVAQQQAAPVPDE